MKRQQPLPLRVRRFIKEHDLIRRNETVLVGVSGGPDSTCLLSILAELRSTLGLRLHVAHLNHLLRGAESDADAEYVSSTARDLGLPATIESQNVRAYQRQHGLSLEEAAREARYAFFARIASALNASTVAVGHTADDQVETILMHLVRGTGLDGIRGMQPLSSWGLPGEAMLRVVRPLLEVRREETEAHCAAQGLSPQDDSSNRWPNQLRNQVRSQLVPLLRSYNPNVDGALLRVARAAGDDLAYIDDETSRLWGRVAREKPEGVAVDRTEFASLHPALKRHLVRSVFRHLLGDLRDIESIHIESLLEAMSKPAGKRLSLPRGLAFHGDYMHGLLTTGKTPPCPYPILESERRLNVPGETEIGGWRVTGTILDQRPPEGQDSDLQAFLDLDNTGEEIRVRGRTRGDRFQPLGMEGTKKLHDFMVDCRIPQPWRDRVPLACSPEHILWVVGWRIDHRARVTPSTRRVLRLEFERT